MRSSDRGMEGSSIPQNDEKLDLKMPEAEELQELARLLAWHQVPAASRERYILTGYRPPRSGAWLNCVGSAFQWHNETINIWTHLLPAFYFIYFALTSVECVAERSLFPFYGYLLAVCALFLISSTAHLCTHCLDLQDVFFMMDYSAISLYGVGAAIVVFAYSRPTEDRLVATEEVFLVGVVILALAASLTCCWTRVSRTSLGHSIRTLAFAAPYVFGSLPAISRCWHDVILHQPAPINQTLLPAQPNSIQGPSFVSAYAWHSGLMVIAGVVNMSRVPERWFPGAFDLVGHSHQWFHVLVFLSIRQQFWFTVSDICPRTTAGRAYGCSINQWYLAISFAVTITVQAAIILVSLKNIAQNGMKSK